MNSNLIDIIESFGDRKVLVVGEAMLDRYLEGNTQRLCREAPAPIVDVRNWEEFPGGAANTAVNVAKLGGQAFFVSVIGSDPEGKSLLAALRRQGVNASWIIQDKRRRTLTKQRVSASGQILVRFDYGSTDRLDEATEKGIINMLGLFYPQVDAVIVSDYGYGLMTDRIIDALGKLQSRHNKMLLVDSKYLERYALARPTAVKPSFAEAVSLLGVAHPESAGRRVEQISGFGSQILRLTNAAIAAITVDVEGSIVFEKKRPAYRTYAVPKENLRAIGAGDTYSSAFALALAGGVDTVTAAELAAGAAAVVVQKQGTAVCTQKELQFYFSANDKFLHDEDRLRLIVNQYRALGKKVVFTNGCFDILHSGHVQYLNSAKSFGDILIVALNSDDSVRRIKGPQRPINTLAERAQVLSALSGVDYLVSFSEDTPIKLIKTIKPDVYVKGGDYTRERLPEAPVVESLGGVVRIVPYINGRSTTKIINQIRESTKTQIPNPN